MNVGRLLKHPKPYLDKLHQSILNVYRRLVYRGNKVRCNVCGWNGQQFFDQKCPVCKSLPRTRLVPFAIKYFKIDIKKSKLLHVAPNYNEFKFIKNQMDDLFHYDRLNIRPVKHINLVQDLTATTLQSDTYDLVIAWHVLEHIPKDKEAIEEVYRLLKPNGYFLVSVPIFPLGNLKTFEDLNIPYAQYEKIHGHYDHCRSCGLDYYQRLESVGFKTFELKIDNISVVQQDFNGLKKDHVVWCFKK